MRAALWLCIHELLFAVASLVSDVGSRALQASVVTARGLSSCVSQALDHRLNSCGSWA